MDKAELIGTIIDTFEDDLHNRCIVNPISKSAVIKLFREDEDCDGVFYGGEHYDNIAKKLETLLSEWGII